MALFIYGKFRSLYEVVTPFTPSPLLEVETLAPNPGEVCYMLLLQTTMLGVETLTPNTVQVRFMLV